MLPQSLDLLRLMLNLFCRLYSKERSADWIFLYMFHIYMSGQFRTDLFRTWYDAKHYSTV